jgi:hypothetical protein
MRQAREVLDALDAFATRGRAAIRGLTESGGYRIVAGVPARSEEQQPLDGGSAEYVEWVERLRQS